MCYNIFITKLAIASLYRRFFKMARVRRLSLRKRREIQKKAEEKAFQYALTSNATDLIMTFVLPRLMSSVKSSSNFSQCPTITIERIGADYFFKMGKYRSLVSFTPINEEVLQEALSLAPAYELVPDGSDGKATFSMVL